MGFFIRYRIEDSGHFGVVIDATSVIVLLAKIDFVVNVEYSKIEVWGVVKLFSWLPRPPLVSWEINNKFS